MDETNEILLAIWREACRHIQIQDSARNMAQLLAKQMPLAGLIVRRFQLDRRSIETVALGASKQKQLQAKPVDELSAESWKRLLAWVRVGEIGVSDHSPRPPRWSMAVPDEVKENVLVGPLSSTEGPAGLLILVAEPEKKFLATHVKLASRLLEPFNVALENDRRLHELAALREAAEADRRSLLSRLGRQDVHEEIIGGETGLRQVMERVELVAQSDVPVLILGETGTGKEVVSRAIHTRSKRSASPFIRVNCGAIPSELIDSQLFGHEKGSFTGAAEQHQGWFERADGGTLFLDEIGELPLAAQVRLLRVLQDHQIERVGGKEPIRIDVRIVAATHRDLASMVKARTFREDLWYRVNVFPILLPRLCERIEDIPALARHFSHRAAIRFGLPHVEASPADLRLLANYSWPGNIREFGAVMDRAAILGNGRSLDIAKSLGLSQPLQPPVPSNEPTLYEVIPEVALPPKAVRESSVEIATLDSAMREHIERALSSTRGRIEGPLGAAALLGINPHTLRARMRKLGVDWSNFRK